MPVGAGMVPEVDREQLEALVKEAFAEFGIDTSQEGFNMEAAVNGILMVVKVMVDYIHQNAILTGVTPGAGTVPFGVK